MAFAFDKDRATELFFRAFKDCVNNIIRDLPNDASRPEAIHAIHTITQQLNGDCSRLVFVNESIQARIWEDEAWAASASVDIYELLAASTIHRLKTSNEGRISGAQRVDEDVPGAIPTNGRKLTLESWFPYLSWSAMHHWKDHKHDTWYRTQYIGQHDPVHLAHG
jgi:hypothetical protein